MPRAKNPIWVHFDCIPKEGNTGSWARCKHCSLEMQGIPGRLNSHLALHPDLEQENFIADETDQSSTSKTSCSGIGDGDLAKEMRCLRKKVKELEATIRLIRDEVQDKLTYVLQRFFNHKTDRIANQKRALEVDEDIYLHLLSKCTSWTEGPEGQSRNKGQVEPTTVLTSKKRKQRRTSSSEVVISLDPFDNGTLIGCSTSADQYRRETRTCKPTSFHNENDVSDYIDNRDDMDYLSDIGRPNENEADSNESLKGGRGGDFDEMAQESSFDEAVSGFAIKKEIFEEHENEDQDVITNELPRQIFNVAGVPKVFVEFIRRTGDQSSIWYYFLREVNGQYARCKIKDCGKILHNRHSTSSLRKHMQGVHKIDLTGTENNVTPQKTATIAIGDIHTRTDVP